MKKFEIKRLGSRFDSTRRSPVDPISHQHSSYARGGTRTLTRETLTGF